MEQEEEMEKEARSEDSTKEIVFQEGKTGKVLNSKTNAEHSKWCSPKRNHLFA